MRFCRAKASGQSPEDYRNKKRKAAFYNSEGTQLN